VHSNPNGQSYHQDEVQNGQGASFVDGTRGTESRREVIKPRLDVEPRSGEVTADPNPKLLDMSLLSLSAMALLQNMMATIFKKGKAPEGEQEMKRGESGAVTKVDVLESSAQGEARSNSEFGKPPYCYRCLSRGHQKEDCVAQLVCEICDSTSHVKAR
jgi:hypothetical protein